MLQETAEPTEDLIGNKIGDKNTSGAKSKIKDKEGGNKMPEIYIPSEKRQQIIDDL